MSTPVATVAAVATTTATAITTPATASATTAATVRPTATAAFGLGARFVDIQRSAAKLRAIQSRDCALCLGFVGHFHKSKASGTARIAICLDADPLYVSVRLKQGTNAFFRSAKIQVPYKNIFHALSFRDLKASSSGQNLGLLLPQGHEPGFAGHSNTSIRIAVPADTGQS
jgi:hypothetical protein